MDRLCGHPDVPLWGLKPRRAETRLIALLTAVRRIGAAIRLWTERSRSRQQLRELGDHMLKDIGLTRGGWSRIPTAVPALRLS
jgi:uncharacterized protein YjiS (DUF1127 family)